VLKILEVLKVPEVLKVSEVHKILENKAKNLFSSRIKLLFQTVLANYSSRIE